MHRQIIILCLLFSFIGCPSAFAFDEWTKEDTTYQLTLGFLKIVDMKQTIKGDNSKYKETNQFIGEDASNRKVRRVFAYGMIIHTGVAYMLPKRFRRPWQCVFIGISFGNVYSNYRAGIRVTF